MGQIQKIGQHFYIEFTARGLKYAQCAGSTEEEAIALLAQIEDKIAKGESLTVVRDIDLIVFVNDFIAHIKDESPATKRRFIALCDHFLMFLSENYPQIHKLSGLTPVVLENYKANLMGQVRPKIVNWTLLLLRDFFNYGIALGLIHDNPLLHIRLLPWEARALVNLDKKNKVKSLFDSTGSLLKVNKYLQCGDIGKLIYFADAFALIREDIYVT